MYCPDGKTDEKNINVLSRWKKKHECTFQPENEMKKPFIFYLAIQTIIIVKDK